VGTGNFWVPPNGIAILGARSSAGTAVGICQAVHVAEINPPPAPLPPIPLPPPKNKRKKKVTCSSRRGTRTTERSYKCNGTTKMYQKTIFMVSKLFFGIEFSKFHIFQICLFYVSILLSFRFIVGCSCALAQIPNSISLFLLIPANGGLIWYDARASLDDWPP
jgi:hypothetical protein